MAVNVIGFSQFADKAGQLPEELLTEFDEAAGIASADWERLQKEFAPVDFGFLKRGISHFQVKKGTWENVSSVYYSPYQEWGTIEHVSVPSDLADYAIQFKGRGILKTGGVHPHPFFFVSKPVIEEQLISDLEQILNTPR